MKIRDKRAKSLLKKYLVRCHESVSADFPEISDMPPENAAEYLIHLRDTGRVKITIDTVDDLLECRIENIKR